MPGWLQKGCYRKLVEMKILKDRNDWLQNRVDGIGGSEASAIVGMNPYMTNVDLWNFKTGQAEQQDISNKPYVQYGIEAEPYMRDLFALDYPQYKVYYQDNNSWRNDKYPFAMASLDGWLTDQDGRKGILEIKTSNILQSMQKEKWKQQIPDNYYIQILHYLLVTEFDFAILKAQLKSEFDGEIYIQTKHFKIERSEVEEDIEYLESSEKRFWEHVMCGKCPPLVLPQI